MKEMRMLINICDWVLFALVTRLITVAEGLDRSSSSSSFSNSKIQENFLFGIDENALSRDSKFKSDFISLQLDDGRSSGSLLISSNYTQAEIDSNKKFLEENGKMDDSLQRFKGTNDFAINYIWRRLPIGFLVLGTIANILSILVFTRKEMRKFSSFCYFAVLNAVNLAFLYVTLTRVIMDFNFQRDIRTLSIFSCKSHVFLTYFLGHLSSLLLSTISIDRVISVVFLHRAKDLCTPRVAFMVTVFLIVFNLIVSSHFIIFDSAHKVDTHINITFNAKQINKSYLDQLHESFVPPSTTAEPMDVSAAASHLNFLQQPTSDMRKTNEHAQHSQNHHHHHHQYHHEQKSHVLREQIEYRELAADDSEYGFNINSLTSGKDVEFAPERNEIVETKVVCDTRNGTFYHYFIRNTWKIIDMSLYAFLPFAIMFTCSVIIIIRVAQQSNKFKARTYKGTSQKQKSSSDMNRISTPHASSPNVLKSIDNGKASSANLKPQRNETVTTLENGFNNESCDPSSSIRSSMNGLDKAPVETTALKVKPSLSLAPTSQIMARNSAGANSIHLAKLRSASSISTVPNINANHRPSEAKFSTRTRNLALMLIPVNILFLMFLSPVVISMYTYENLGNDQLTLAIVEHLSYCNFTLNFFIYFLTSSKFREEFFKLLNETFRTSTLQNNAAYANTAADNRICFNLRFPFFKQSGSSPSPNALGKTRYQSINNNKSSTRPAPNPANSAINHQNSVYTPLQTEKLIDQAKSSPRLSKINQLISAKNKNDDELVAMTTTYLHGNDSAE